MNQKALEQAMKKMGVKQENIDADEVIIKKGSENIVIKNPQVVKINMMGQESFQIVGEITKETNISEEDMNTVAEQANVSKEKARKMLKETDGDLADAILRLNK